GRRLFRYRDGDSAWHNVESGEVNEYLKELAGFPYSAKDFRTWGGTLRAATVLADIGAAQSERDAKKNVATAIRLVASELGNTPTICRASYVHPVVIERYLEHGDTIRIPASAGHASAHGSRTQEERALIQFLDEYFPDRRQRRRTDSE